jgi:hypothetical protein
MGRCTLMKLQCRTVVRKPRQQIWDFANVRQLMTLIHATVTSNSFRSLSLSQT